MDWPRNCRWRKSFLQVIILLSDRLTSSFILWLRESNMHHSLPFNTIWTTLKVTSWFNSRWKDDCVKAAGSLKYTTTALGIINAWVEYKLKCNSMKGWELLVCKKLTKIGPPPSFSKIPWSAPVISCYTAWHSEGDMQLDRNVAEG